MNQPCVTRENLQGTCLNYNQCQKARDDYNRGIYPTLCPSGRTFVCCANTNQSKIRISEKSNLMKTKHEHFCPCLSNKLEIRI